MDDPQNAIAAGGGLFGITAFVWQVVKYIGDVIEKRGAAQAAAVAAKTASDEKVALAKIAVENEQDKAELRTRIAILTEKTARCEDGHKDCQETNAKLQSEHSQLWKELAAVKGVLPPIPPSQ